jgi:hypothetical protein
MSAYVRMRNITKLCHKLSNTLHVFPKILEDLYVFY